jgi:hypothetical protein
MGAARGFQPEGQEDSGVVAAKQAVALGSNIGP